MFEIKILLCWNKIHILLYKYEKYTEWFHQSHKSYITEGFKNDYDCAWNGYPLRRFIRALQPIELIRISQNFFNSWKTAEPTEILHTSFAKIVDMTCKNLMMVEKFLVYLSMEGIGKTNFPIFHPGEIFTYHVNYFTKDVCKIWVLYVQSFLSY